MSRKIEAVREMERYCNAHPATPSALKRPQLLFRGGVWIALLGRNIPEGIVGFGYTVEAALRAFDAQYLCVSTRITEVVDQVLPLSEKLQSPEASEVRHSHAERSSHTSKSKPDAERRAA